MSQDKENKTFREITVNSSRIEHWNIPDKEPVQFINQDGSVSDVDVKKSKMIKESRYGQSGKGEVKHSLPAPSRTVPVKHLKKSVDNLIEVIEDMQKGKEKTGKISFVESTNVPVKSIKKQDPLSPGPNKRTLAGAGLGGLAGTALGGMAGGPAGALAGGALGTGAGALAAEKTKNEKSAAKTQALNSVQKAIDLVSNEIQKGKKTEKGMMGGLSGAAGGAGLGGLIGGPLGAVAGGGLGGLAGNAMEDMTSGQKAEKCMVKKDYSPEEIQKAIEVVGDIIESAGNVELKKQWQGAALKLAPAFAAGYAGGKAAIKKAVAEPAGSDKGLAMKDRKPMFDNGGESEIGADGTKLNVRSLQPSKINNSG